MGSSNVAQLGANLNDVHARALHLALASASSGYRDERADDEVEQPVSCGG
jgi:hypothetical protein